MYIDWNLHSLTPEQKTALRRDGFVGNFLPLPLAEKPLDMPASIVPPADPSVLIKMWEELKRIKRGGDRDEEFIQFSKSVDLEPAWFRLDMLQTLQTMPKHMEMFAPWTHDGEIDEAVVKAFAIVPMKPLQPGKNSITSLVDLAEVIQLITNAA